MSEKMELAISEKLSLPQVLQLGEVLHKSGYFDDVKSASQAVVKILRGQELNIGAVTSLEQIYVIKGRTALSAGLIGSLIKDSGRYNYHIVQHTDDICEIIFLEGNREIGKSEFTTKDAERAGLLQKAMWKQYPRNLLFARALSNGAKWFCPEIFGGTVYTPEELQTIDLNPHDIHAQQPPDPQPIQPIQPICSPDAKAVFAIIGVLTNEGVNREIATDALKSIVYTRYNVQSSKELTIEQWQELRADNMLLQTIRHKIVERDMVAAAVQTSPEVIQQEVVNA